MAATRADPALRFDAGTPWLDLLATVGGAYGSAPTERLGGVPELTAWLAHEGLTPREPLTDADVAAAREVREALRPVALAVLAHHEVDVVTLEALQPWLDRDEPLRVLSHAGCPIVEAPRTAVVALARVCRQAVEHLTGPERDHLGARGRAPGPRSVRNGERALRHGLMRRCKGVACQQAMQAALSLWGSASGGTRSGPSGPPARSRRSSAARFRSR